MTREDYIKNNAIIQKSLKTITKDDMQYLQYIANGGNLDPKDLRLKQLIHHMCSGLNMFELIKLRKSFNTLMKL